jgi:hypothetical protein
MREREERCDARETEILICCACSTRGDFPSLCFYAILLLPPLGSLTSLAVQRQKK